MLSSIPKGPLTPLPHIKCLLPICRILLEVKKKKKKGIYGWEMAPSGLSDSLMWGLFPSQEAYMSEDHRQLVYPTKQNITERQVYF